MTADQLQRLKEMAEDPYRQWRLPADRQAIEAILAERAKLMQCLRDVQRASTDDPSIHPMVTLTLDDCRG